MKFLDVFIRKRKIFGNIEVGVLKKMTVVTDMNREQELRNISTAEATTHSKDTFTEQIILDYEAGTLNLRGQKI